MTSEPVRSRRAVLAAAAGAVAASAASAISAPLAVRAAGDDGTDIKVGHVYDDARTTTEIGNATNNSTVVHGFSGKGGVGVYGQSVTGIGVLARSKSKLNAAAVGTSSTSTGVMGLSGDTIPPSSPAKTGVYGRSDKPGGIGVLGQTSDETNETYGVQGLVDSSQGRGVFGWALNDTTGGAGVWGQSNSHNGVGVRGYAWDGFSSSGKFGTGVIGSSGSSNPAPNGLPNTGVLGIGVNGRGGVFKGDKAQVRLVPSTATTHPTRGSIGDLFLDKKKRLWLCRGGKDWKQIA